MTVGLSVRSAVAGGLLLVVAGCGFQQVQPGARSGAVSTPAPVTPVPVPTVTVSGGNIAATVDGGSIPMPVFKDFLNVAVKQSGGATPAASIARQTINSLVQQELIRRYADTHGLGATADQITRQIDAYYRQTPGGRTAFLAGLNAHGFTMADVRFNAAYVVDGKQLEKVLAPLRTSGPVATARHILIFGGVGAQRDRCLKKILSVPEAKAEAQTLESRVSRGSSFADLARKCSDDTSSAVQGGSLSGAAGNALLYPLIESFVPSFEAAVFHGPVHSLQLVRSRFGWHVIQVLSRYNGKYPTAVQSQLQGAQFQAWLTRQTAKAKIHVIETVK